MNQFQDNPFGLLTFIVAPAILTNASSIMALGTSNRFARAMDRARELTNQIKGNSENDPETARRIVKLRYTERRGRLLVRALTAFYLSVGSFAAASLISLLGAVFFITHYQLLHQIGCRRLRRHYWCPGLSDWFGALSLGNPPSVAHPS
jgi:hypothetical protein